MTSDLSSARTSATGRQPHDIRVSNRYPRPRTYTRRPFNLCHEGCYEVVQQVVVWFDFFYPDTQGCCSSLYTVYIQKPSVLWRGPFLLSVGLALVFMSGLYSTVYRATSCVFMRLPLVCFYCLFDFVCGCFLLASAFPAHLRTYFGFDWVWFRLSCDHGWIRSESVHVR